MPKLLVISDDLTGAADTGSRLAAQGVNSLVVVDYAAIWPDAAADCEALLINIESRHLGAEEAARRVRTVALRGATLGFTHFYKKTDSTLRGNIGAELEALRIATGRNVLPYLPAYPKLGRTTTGGRQHVGGQALHETAFAADPLNPITDSFIPAIIATQTRTPCLVSNPATFCHMAGAVSGEVICVIDAEKDEDLRRAGELLKEHGMLKVTAGSAGFAEHLPRLLGIEKEPPQIPRAAGHMLVAAGSLNEVSLSQLAHAEARGGFASVILSPAALAMHGGARTREAYRTVEEATAHARVGRDVIVRSVGGAGDFEPYLERARSFGVGRRELHMLVAENLAEVISGVVEAGAFRILTVFGGDTLLAVVRSLGWTTFRPLGEVLPGVAVSEVAGHTDCPLVVSKAGGFGGAEVLTVVRDLLMGEDK